MKPSPSRMRSTFGDDARRVAGAAVDDVGRGVEAGHLADDAQDVEHAELPSPRPMLYVAPGCAALERPRGGEVGVGDVGDVDVVADAGAVGRRVVAAEHLRPLAGLRAARRPSG